MLNTRSLAEAKSRVSCKKARLRVSCQEPESSAKSDMKLYICACMFGTSQVDTRENGPKSQRDHSKRPRIRPHTQTYSSVIIKVARNNQHARFSRHGGVDAGSDDSTVPDVMRHWFVATRVSSYFALENSGAGHQSSVI